MDNYQSNAGSEFMSDKIFTQFSEFIEDKLGIKMPRAKKTMLQARLQKRLRQLNMGSFEEYFAYVFSSEGMKEELSDMVNVVTTNKTDFFREPRHFEFLTQSVLPELIRRGCGIRKPLGIWSAGCSVGMEPYTLSMVLSEYAKQCRGFRFSILATDISTRVLKEALRAVYSHEAIEPVAMPLRRKYILKSKDKTKDLVRIIPELRACVRFQQLNFMDEEYGIHEQMDIIFCRNVIIYFDRTTQEKVLNRLCRHLNSGGYMFMGHSETLNNLKVPLIQIISTVYQKAS